MSSSEEAESEDLGDGSAIALAEVALKARVDETCPKMLTALDIVGLLWPSPRLRTSRVVFAQIT